MLLPKGCSGSLLENLHFNPPDILVYPFIKDSAEKHAPRFCRHSALAYAAVSGWLRFDQRQKGYVLGFDLLEEPVNLDGVLDII
jgi:hypothetical protein